MTLSFLCLKKSHNLKSKTKIVTNIHNIAFCAIFTPLMSLANPINIADSDMQGKADSINNLANALDAHPMYENSVIAKSGFFLGVSGGGSIVTPDYSNTTYTTKFPYSANASFNLNNMRPQIEGGWAVGAKIGYRLFIGQSWGFKAYMDYHFSESFATKKVDGIAPPDDFPAEATYRIIRNAHLIAANFDFFYHRDRLGGFIGLGLGYQGYSFNTSINTIYSGTGQNAAFTTYNDTIRVNEPFKGTFAMPLNIGVSYDLSMSNQLSLTAKIPLLSYNYTYSNTNFNGKSSLRNYLLVVEYSYTF